jgi:hypothetical protein
VVKIFIMEYEKKRLIKVFENITPENVHCKITERTVKNSCDFFHNLQLIF